MSNTTIKNIKKDFPWFKNNRGWTYLDSSATSLKPQCVIDAIDDYYSKYCTNPHNTDSVFTYKVNQKIDEVRQKLAKLINADKNEVIFTSGATESLNLIANGLKDFIKSNDEIIITYGEHGSNIIPWINIKNEKKCLLTYVGKEKKPPIENDIIKAVSKKTKIVAFSSVSNLMGYELNVSKIVHAIKKINKNIIVVIDATQSIPHAKFNVKTTNVDFAVCSAHKMCGGTGVGMAYIKYEWATKIKPLRYGGDMNADIINDKFIYAQIPYRFEGGTSNVAGIISWGAAIDYLNKLGWNNIKKHEQELNIYIKQQFKSLKNIEFLNPYSKYPIALFNIKGVYAQDVSSYLGKQKIIVRSGLSCARLAHKIIDTRAAIRASFYIYNTKQDIDCLVNFLKKFKKGDELRHVI